MKNLSQLIGGLESTKIEWKPSLSQVNEIIEAISGLANTEGGKIFIGVSNIGKIIGIQIGKGTIENLTNQISLHTDPKVHPKIITKRIQEKEIIIVQVKESTDHLVLAYGKPFIRVGKSTLKMSKDEYERLILEKHKGKLFFDEQICKNAKIRDISEDKLKSFVKKAREQRGLSINIGSPVVDVLRKLKLIKGDKLTNAAILLFGKEPQDYFLQSELKAIRFKGINETGPMLDFKTIGGDAITLLEKAESFIYDHIPMKAWIESGKLQRQEKWLYPPDAIREALANALAHRDYASPGKVQVRIYDDRLEIWNPGLLPSPLTVENLKRKHDSIPRNPLIAKAFFWIKFAEDVGSGTSKIVQWCKKWGLPDPIYEEAGGSFVTIFHNPKQDESVQKTSEQKVTVKVTEKVTVNQKKIIEYISKNANITIAELSKLVAISERKIKVNIMKLKQKGLLKRIGPDKGGHWEVVER